MEEIDVMIALGQAEGTEAGEVMESYVRGVARQAVVEVMAEEVKALCGGRYVRGQPRERRRGGSAPGTVHVGGRSESIRRPRVRERGAEGTERERPLKTYEAARVGEELRAAILRALECGVSCRDQQRVHPEAGRCSKSEVSRQWEQAGRRHVEELRSRALAPEGYVALMLDGVSLSDELTAIVALGIRLDGVKEMLDFEIGASENAEVSQALCERLQERGFKPSARRLYAVLDGSQALRKAVLAVWPTACIQRCLVHLERNVRGRLSRRRHSELRAAFQRLRKAGDKEAAHEAFESLLKYVGKHTHEGMELLAACREDALRLFDLEVGDGLNRSLLSTNAIENAIRNMRSVLSRTKRWRAETDMASRWLACAMRKAESGFHRLSGYRELGRLAEALDSTV
jgi:transposase-like protein